MRLLKRYRLASGLTQAELAGRLHVSTAAVCTWETGRYLPSAKHCPKLARALGLKPLELTRVLDPDEGTEQDAAPVAGPDAARN